MARPKKNNCDYFPHDNNMRNHTKVKAIRHKFPNGYAIWSMLLEYLTSCDGNEFENTDLEYELLAGDFGVSVTEIRDVVNYCIKLEMLFEHNGFVSSESLNERLAPVYEKRSNGKEISKKQQRRAGRFCDTKTEGNGVSATETTVSHGESATETPQSKVNRTKVNRTELKERKVKGTEVKAKRKNSLPPGSTPLKKPHSFRDSEYFEKEKFSAGLDSSPPPYCNANAEFYYDAALNGSDSKGYKYLDWMAAIKNWIRKDAADEKMKTKFSEPKKINANSSKFDRSQQISDHNQDQLRRVMDGSL